MKRTFNFTVLLLTLALTAGCYSEPLSLEERAAEAQEELQDAREEAAEQIAEAEEDAVEILSDARAEAEKEVASAKIEAKETINEAERKLDEMMEMIADEDDIAGTSPADEPAGAPDTTTDTSDLD